MIVIITRDVVPRFRGFLASCMLEIGPGIYTSPHMTRCVRERVWNTLHDWYNQLNRGSIIMTWKDKNAPGGQAILTIGAPPIKISECDGLFLGYRSRISDL